MGHIDFSTQNMRTILELAATHSLKKVEILLNGSCAIGAFFTDFGQGAAIGPDIIGAQAVDIGLSFFNELAGVRIKLFEIIRGKEAPLSPIEAKPAYILLNGFYIFDIFLGGVGVIKSQITGAVVFGCQAKVQTDRFGMADMQVSIWFRWKAGRHFLVELVGFEIVFDDIADKVGWRRHGRIPG